MRLKISKLCYWQKNRMHFVTAEIRTKSKKIIELSYFERKKLEPFLKWEILRYTPVA